MIIFNNNVCSLHIILISFILRIKSSTPTSSSPFSIGIHFNALSTFRFPEFVAVGLDGWTYVGGLCGIGWGGLISCFNIDILSSSLVIIEPNSVDSMFICDSLTRERFLPNISISLARFLFFSLVNLNAFFISLNCCRNSSFCLCTMFKISLVEENRVIPFYFGFHL